MTLSGTADRDYVLRTAAERLCEWYVLNKRREWEECRRTVSAFEHRRYLGVL